VSLVDEKQSRQADEKLSPLVKKQSYPVYL